MKEDIVRPEILDWLEKTKKTHKKENTIQLPLQIPIPKIENLEILPKEEEIEITISLI